MTTLGTNYLESVNCTLAKFATKRSDFPVTHWARAQIAIMNRTHPSGSLGIANRIRCKVGLEQLSEDAAKRVERRDTRGKGVVGDQPFRTPQQKEEATAQKYAMRSRTSDHTAMVRQSFGTRMKNDPLKPFGHGNLGVAAVRASIDDPQRGNERGADGAGKTASHKGKGKQRGGTKRSKSGSGGVLPEYTAAGSNADKNDKVASDVRMGPAPTAVKVCGGCLDANVGYDFLLAAKHTRRGNVICRETLTKWHAHVAAMRTRGRQRQRQADTDEGQGVGS